MAVTCSPGDVCTVLFQCIKGICLWIWSFLVAVLAALTSTGLLIWTITIFLFITGASLLTAGIFSLVSLNNYFTIIESTFFFLPIFLIVIAVVIFLSAILGHYGVTREKYDFVVAYMTLLVVILLMESIITGIFFEMDNNRSEGYWILQKMNGSLANFVQSPRKDDNNNYNYYYRYYYQQEAAKLWSTMQQELRCCGFHGVDDFVDKIPVSCCDIPMLTFAPLVCTVENAFTLGCYDSLRWFLDSHVFIAAILSASVTGVQGIITVLAAFITFRLKYRQAEERGYKGLLESPMDQASGIDYCTDYQVIPGQIVLEPDSSDTV